MVKAKLLELQSPVGITKALRSACLGTGLVFVGVSTDDPHNSEDQDSGNEPLVEMSGAPKSRSIRSTPRERGIAYGARALWRQSSHSSQMLGVMPETRRRGTGDIGQEGKQASKC
jgi:hypothetical protein